VYIIGDGRKMFDVGVNVIFATERQFVNTDQGLDAAELSQSLCDLGQVTQAL